MKKSNFAAFCLMLAALCLTFIFTGCEEPVQVSFYTVTYESAHGTTPESITVPENTVLNEQQLPELEETGWKFKGWYEEEKPAKPGKYKVTKNVTLTALWASDLQVNYTSIFGTSPAKLTGFQKGYQLTSEDLPVLSDGIHTFVGWRNSVTGNLVDEGFAVNTAVTLEAVWISYDVTIGFTNTTYTIYYGDKVPASCFELPEQEGKTVSSWILSPDGTGIDIDNFYPISDCVISTVWSLNAYRVKYYKNSDEATGSMNDQNLYYSLAYNLPENKYTLIGNDFTGWNTKADGSGTAYTDGGSITIPAHDIDLYAQWTPKQFTVTFYPNGASGSSYTQTFYYGVSAPIESCSFTYANYRFVGWNTKADGTGTSYEDEADFSIGLGNVSLYAQWIPADAYTITYRNTHGAENSNPATYRTSLGTTFSSISRTGYDFDGWYEYADSEGNGTGTRVSSFEANSKSGDVVLYAKWTPKTYTVTFMPNGGAESSYTQTVTYDSPVALTANAFTYRYYSFTGWNTKADGSGTSYDDEEEYTTGTADLTLYAQWVEADRYTVTYENTKGASNSNPATFRGSVGLTLKPLSSAGFVFDGWCESADSEGNGTGTVLTEIAAGTKEGNITLYAKWSLATDTNYKVKIWKENAEDDEYTYDDYLYSTGTTGQMTAYEPEEIEHYTAQPVTQAVINADGSTVINVYYKLDVHTVTIDYNDGRASVVQHYKYGAKITLETPASEGLTFYSWFYISAAGSQTGSFKVENYACRQDNTFTAQWKKTSGITVTVTQESDMEVTKSVEGSIVSITVPEGYTVNAWRIDGVLQSSKENTLTIDASSLSTGVYAVFVYATKNSNAYSAQINVEVE